MTEGLRIALDTNILVYAGGYNGEGKQAHTHDVLDRIGAHTIVLPSQVIGELFHLIVRKFAVPRLLARGIAENWQKRLTLHAADEATFEAARDLAAAHNLQFWDALILATAAAARCRLLLSEDLQDGFVYRGCTVANPFLPVLHPLLRDGLERG